MDRKDRYILAEKALTELLALKRKPVGIKFLKTKEDYEKAEAQEPKTGLPYCTAVAKAGVAKTGENQMRRRFHSPGHAACKRIPPFRSDARRLKGV